MSMSILYGTTTAEFEPHLAGISEDDELWYGMHTEKFERLVCAEIVGRYKERHFRVLTIAGSRRPRVSVEKRHVEFCRKVDGMFARKFPQVTSVESS